MNITDYALCVCSKCMYGPPITLTNIEKVDVFLTFTVKTVKISRVTLGYYGQFCKKYNFTMKN